MRIDAEWIQKSRPDDIQIALLAAEVRRLQAVIASTGPALTDEEREAIEIVNDWATEHLGEDDPGVIALRKLLERMK